MKKKIELSAYKILLFGPNGQLGKSIYDLFTDQQIQFTSLDRNKCNFLDKLEIIKCLDSYKPNIIINAVAYTNVESAEADDQVYLINSEAPAIIADWCNENDSVFVHYSTDYVFSGEKTSMYAPHDQTNPINKYGESKLIGEKKILKSKCKSLIFRTSWVYSSIGTNFIKKIISQLLENKKIRVVNDQFGNPTYAKDLGLYSMQALTFAMNCKDFPTGIYHLTNLGSCSWYEFALEISKKYKKIYEVNNNFVIEPVSSSEFKTLARRPQYSKLDIATFIDRFGITPRSFHETLSECIREIKNAN